MYCSRDIFSTILNVSMMVGLKPPIGVTSSLDIRTLSPRQQRLACSEAYHQLASVLLGLVSLSTHNNF